MNYSQETSQVISAYLANEFPDFTLTEERREDSYCFRLVGEQDSHFLRVMFSALETIDVSLIELLEQYAVAQTMKNLGDFPVVVTESGCMFGSP